MSIPQSVQEALDLVDRDAQATASAAAQASASAQALASAQAQATADTAAVAQAAATQKADLDALVALLNSLYGPNASRSRPANAAGMTHKK